MEKFSSQNRIKVSTLMMGMIAIVAGLVVLVWILNTLIPRPNPPAEPAPLQIQTPTPTGTVPFDPTAPEELAVTEKPAITTLPVELIPATYSAYEGTDEQGSAGAANLLIHIIDGIQAYTLEYSLPEDDRGALVGLAFSFLQNQDLSEYGFVQVTIDFGGPDTSCEFYLRDADDSPQAVDRISLGHVLSGDGISFFTIGEFKYTYTIPLDSNFPDTDFSAIREMGFSLRTPSAHGDHEITFSDIKFVSP